MAPRLCAALLACLVTIAGATTAAGTPSCSEAAPRAQTFYIEMEVAEDSYRIGEKAVFHFEISRPAEKDPIEQGIPLDPPYRHPAEGVSITLSLWAKNKLPKSEVGGPTDADGKATMAMVLDERFKKGVEFADVYAFIRYPKAGCLDPEEWGKRIYEKPFEIEH